MKFKINTPETPEKKRLIRLDTLVRVKKPNQECLETLKKMYMDYSIEDIDLIIFDCPGKETPEPQPDHEEIEPQPDPAATELQEVEQEINTILYSNYEENQELYNRLNELKKKQTDLYNIIINKDVT